MKEVLYLEVPTPDTAAVQTWLQAYDPILAPGTKTLTANGFHLQVGPGELTAFVWSLQRTTYLKVFRWTPGAIPGEAALLKDLTRRLRAQFPETYPVPPVIDLAEQTIFAALADRYPKTVEFFQKIPNGEYDLNRVYWWEQRWREGARNPQKPRQVVFGLGERLESSEELLADRAQGGERNYDVIYIGGALGVIHAAVMARLGYRVLLIERLPFGRMNREWNISRAEFQSLIDLGLFTAAEFEGLIAAEYVDGFHKFFDGNNPPQARAKILHTPTVLNIAIDSEKLLRLCGDKLTAAGGEIWDQTEFLTAETGPQQVTVTAQHLPTQKPRQALGRLLIDAMGTASPIAWQLNGQKAFDSVCPTVGAVIESGFEPQVWDRQYGDVLNSHGDISRGRQLIWELFPGADGDLTFYLFHYHQVNPENPGSLLEMYEDFFTILPEYRRCDMAKIKWKKATFGYIPGYFSLGTQAKPVALDRLVAIGDAAALQSPLVFTGFGSLVRNLGRLTHLLDTALQHDLLSARHLNQIQSYQSNVAVTWMFSKGMMVPTGKSLAPPLINSMLNTFFDVLADIPPAVADGFIKDRVTWLNFNKMALVAARKNPALLGWIVQTAGVKDLVRWLGVYFDFTWNALLGALLLGWFPGLLKRYQPWLEAHRPGLWLWLLARCYAITYGLGQPQAMPVFAQRARAASPDRPLAKV
jgi:lycopene cyclase CruA